ncbi:hypothetical protein B0T14DRAFT_504989 [Immersiella caudata]|uniref:Transmembrane protein n=1 Tax=Immersiella caudata TaxID=314043 RepID=A0AA39XEZ6_9PEZI|nr:hypothetical protein B0T14DRAFT_504989 [Immersiella caudata]
MDGIRYVLYVFAVLRVRSWLWVSAYCLGFLLGLVLGVVGFVLGLAMLYLLGACGFGAAGLGIFVSYTSSLFSSIGSIVSFGHHVRFSFEPVLSVVGLFRAICSGFLFRVFVQVFCSGF